MRTKIALSKVDILPDDIFLVSYPRSGNTWTSLLLSNYVSELDYDKHGIESSVVSELYYIPKEVLAQRPRPRVIKIHAPFEESLPRVIYLVRDVRDVAVSYYYFYLKNQGEITFEDYLKRFNAGTLDRFGLWNYHVNSWLDHREESENFLLVRYEDLKADPHQQLSRMVKFIWGEVDSERIDFAIKATDISRLQKSEQKSNWFSETNTDINFFRKGIVGDWKNYFSPDLLRGLMLFHGRGLKRLGYIQEQKQIELPDDFEGIMRSDIKPSTLENFDLQIYQQQQYLYETKEQLHNMREQLRKERENALGQSQPSSSCNTIANPFSKGAKLQKQLEKAEQQAVRRKDHSHHLRVRLKEKTAKLQEIQTTLRLTQAEINEMRSSKFWKVRSLWIRLKAYLGFSKSPY